MKRALAILTTCILFGFVGSAQFSGEWSAKLGILPAIGIEEMSLTLNYTISGWTLSSVSEFGTWTQITDQGPYTGTIVVTNPLTGIGYTWTYNNVWIRTETQQVGLTSQKLQATGTIGPISLDMSMEFSPLANRIIKDRTYTLGGVYVGPPINQTTSVVIPDVIWIRSGGPFYLSSSLSASLSFAGVEWSLDITHEVDYVYSLSATGVDTAALELEVYQEDQECADKVWLVANASEYEVDSVTIVYLNAFNVPIGTYTVSGPFDLVNLFVNQVQVIDALGNTYTYYTANFTPAATAYLGAVATLNAPTALTGNPLFDPPAVTFLYTIDPNQVVGTVEYWIPSYMTYTLGVDADPFYAEIVFDDVCTGVQFKELTLGFEDLSLCCGVTFDAELSFNKCRGFDSLTFSVTDLFPICCGISFDLSVEFTTDAKTVTLTPKLADIGEACLEVYADIESSGGENSDLYLNGIRFDGWKIRCELAECNYIEFVSFLSPDKAEDYGYEDVFEGAEFEYIKLGFCGPGCCGGEYSSELGVFFDGSGLLGSSRITADLSIPVMSNFSVSMAFEASTSAAASFELDVGWIFTF